jgi:hypothetical protein
MVITTKAQEIAKTVRNILTSGEIPPFAQTERRGEDLAPTADEIWNEIEDRLAKNIVPLVEEAYAAGKHDGFEEAKLKRRQSLASIALDKG